MGAKGKSWRTGKEQKYMNERQVVMDQEARGAKTSSECGGLKVVPGAESLSSAAVSCHFTLELHC